MQIHYASDLADRSTGKSTSRRPVEWVVDAISPIALLTAILSDSQGAVGAALGRSSRLNAWWESGL
jgi:hypothetical protein